MKGRVSEIFDSVQGEGLYMGEKQIFVRFFGCNLNNCSFCDTKLNYFEEYEVLDLFNRIKSFGNGFHSISFTGGEPLLQKDFLKEMLKLTKETGYLNYLETNATLSKELEEVIGYLDIIAMDFKLPSSTGQFPYWKAHRRFLEIALSREVFIKIVICLSTQIEDLIYVLNLVRETNQIVTVILQPNSNERGFMLDKKLEHYRTLCEENAFATCIIPQMHKILKVK